MTATIFFIRHARHQDIGRTLSGRRPGLSLSEAGRGEAAALSARLSSWRFGSVHSSPVQRARETAAAIAGDSAVVVADALQEVDFGEWTGSAFADLDARDDWRDWNENRGHARAPGGENMAQVQARVVAHTNEVARRHPGQAVALVSHMDVIRAAIAHFLGLSLHRLLSFDIEPASWSRVAVGEWGGRVMSVNETVG